MYRILHIPTLKYVVEARSWLAELDICRTVNMKKITISKTTPVDRSSGRVGYGIIKFHNKETLEAYFNLFKQYLIYEDGSGMIFLDVAAKDTKPINRVEFIIERC